MEMNRQLDYFLTFKKKTGRYLFWNENYAKPIFRLEKGSVACQHDAKVAVWYGASFHYDPQMACAWDSILTLFCSNWQIPLALFNKIF